MMNFIFSYAHAQTDSVFDLKLSAEQGLYFRAQLDSVFDFMISSEQGLYFR